MATTTITVEGMTCQHCVAAVTEELGRLDGVQQVEVDLGSGEVRVEATELPTVEAMAAAVAEAGYEVVS